MNDITRYWVAASSIQSKEVSIPVRQVYVWLLTSDNKVVIVSKDSKKWQFPGGKPEPNESILQTAVREVREETGADITPYSDQLEMFGYYTVNEPGSDPLEYLQIRTIVKLPISSLQLNLHVDSEDTRQTADDQIRFVAALSLDEVLNKVPWLPETPEFQSVQPLL